MHQRSRAANEGNSERSPHWDAENRELWWDDVLVKRYVAAPSQEYLLAVFEESGWPERMDDPLPRCGRTIPERRLYEAVRNLNRGQISPCLLFEVEPGGKGLQWHVRQEMIFGDY